MQETLGMSQEKQRREMLESGIEAGIEIKMERKSK